MRDRRSHRTGVVHHLSVRGISVDRVMCCTVRIVLRSRVGSMRCVCVRRSVRVRHCMNRRNRVRHMMVRHVMVRTRVSRIRRGTCRSAVCSCVCHELCASCLVVAASS